MNSQISLKHLIALTFLVAADVQTETVPATPLPESAANVESTIDMTKSNSSMHIEDGNTVKYVPSTFQSIHGSLTLDGKGYRIFCECSQALGLDSPISACRPPSTVRVHQERVNQKLGLSIDDIHALLGSHNAARILDLDSTQLYDIDLRSSEPVLASPGGELGEFIIGVGVYDSMQTNKLEDKDIVGLFKDYIVWTGRGTKPLLHCTDEKSVARIARRLGAGLAGPLNPMRPDKVFQRKYLDQLQHSANFGTPFFQMIMAESHQFYIRPEVAYATIRAFYNVLWGNEGTYVIPSSNVSVPLQSYVELANFPDAQVSAKAWVNFRGSTPCEGEHRFPAFIPMAEKGPIYVSQTKAAEVYRAKIARFLANRESKLQLQADEILHRMNSRAEMVLKQLSSVLGKSIPFYTVYVE